MPSSALCKQACVWPCLLALVWLAGCTKEPLYNQQSYVFGTLVEVSVWGGDKASADQAIGKVLREFDGLHQRLHAWKPSELSSLNQAIAKGEPAKVATDLATILQEASNWSARSNGSFNPAIGKLVEAWGFHADEYKPALPDPAKISALVMAKPAMSDLKISGDTVASSNRTVQLDLGGYAKGYALDVAAKRLRAEGIQNALINIGGNIIALGDRGVRPWRVGVQHPRKPMAIASLDLYDGEAIGTSGDYQRFIEVAGKRYCHLIDPRTGQPVQGVQAVTVVVPRGEAAGVQSDVASKPIFIAGVQSWRKAARDMGVELALLVDDKGEIYLTTLMAKRITLLDKSAKVHEVP